VTAVQRYKSVGYIFFVSMERILTYCAYALRQHFAVGRYLRYMVLHSRADYYRIAAPYTDFFRCLPYRIRHRCKTGKNSYRTAYRRIVFAGFTFYHFFHFLSACLFCLVKSMQEGIKKERTISRAL